MRTGGDRRSVIEKGTFTLAFYCSVAQCGKVNEVFISE